VLDEFVEADDVEQALFGSEALRVHVDGARVVGQRLVRERDGFWTGRKRPSYTRVSASLVTINLFPWMVASTWPTLWLNPFVRRAARLKPWQFFELPTSWPS
jgi:hypothetical protein